MITEEKVNKCISLFQQYPPKWESFIEMCHSGLLEDNDMFNLAFRIYYANGGAEPKTFVESFASIANRLKPEEASDLEGKVIFDNLPDTLQVYRGTSVEEMQSKGEIYNPSWSLDRGVAEWFAFKHYGDDEGRVVLAATIQKSEILAVLEEHREKEALCCIEKKRVQIVTKEATDAFDDYDIRKAKWEEERLWGTDEDRLFWEQKKKNAKYHLK